AGSLARIPGDIRAVGFAHGTPLNEAGIAAFLKFVDRLQ
ncbi:MAG: hypothetical protein JWO67_3545, partial [Streptosporangiaceae bacterium]|nr:hypothetical protein [Streptosporangiaceae bacterium]